MSEIICIEQIQSIKNESILEVTTGGWDIPNIKAGSLCVWILTSNEKVINNLNSCSHIFISKITFGKKDIL